MRHGKVIVCLLDGNMVVLWLAGCGQTTPSTGDLTVLGVSAVKIAQACSLTGIVRFVQSQRLELAGRVMNSPKRRALSDES